MVVPIRLYILNRVTPPRTLMYLHEHVHIRACIHLWLRGEKVQNSKIRSRRRSYLLCLGRRQEEGMRRKGERKPGVSDANRRPPCASLNLQRLDVFPSLCYKGVDNSLNYMPFLSIASQKDIVDNNRICRCLSSYPDSTIRSDSYLEGNLLSHTLQHKTMRRRKTAIKRRERTDTERQNESRRNEEGSDRTSRA